MTETYSVDIRAAAFWRLVSNIYTLTDPTPSIFVGEITKDYFPYYGEENEISVVLAPIIYRMNITKECALSDFPTDNKNMLAKAIVRILLCYINVPEIYNKINDLYVSQITVTMFATTSQSKAASIRANELKTLNENLRYISKKFNRTNINASVKFIKLVEHDFHPESQFIRFCIN